ncbi:MAG TPA: ABC transporter substrate-binding protein [Stellaceae bacterium]|nr:ABC transporter substrate-binding protein [Stellaceae bacterium]
MTGLSFTFACSLYDRVLPLYTGEVKPDGIDLNFIVIDDPRQTFDRMGGGLEFDSSEMSSSEFISRKSAGKCPFVALPAFVSRVFRHGLIFVNRRSGIRAPKDLEGKRIGVPLYTMTAAIFIRGILKHEYGVDLSQVHWVQGAINKPGAHGAPAVPPLLKPVSIENNNSRKSLSDLLEQGEIDAIIGTDRPDAMRHNPEIARLFPDFREVEKEFYRRTRIFPIMHLVVIRRDVYEQHPFVATSLYNALCRSRELALAKMKYLGTLRYMLPWMTADLDEIDEVFGGDPWPYGVEDNRPTLEALVTYLAEQSLIAAPIPVADLFVPTYGRP